MAIQVTRTYVGSIQNQRQVQSGLDSLGDSTSKIWNVHTETATLKLGWLRCAPRCDVPVGGSPHM